MANSKALVVIDMGIDTHQEPLVYMREDCHVCRAEGFNASSRVLLTVNDRQLIATLNVVDNAKLLAEHVGLSRIALKSLRVVEGDRVFVHHAPVVSSFSAVRKKSTAKDSAPVRFSPLLAILVSTAIVILR